MGSTSSKMKAALEIIELKQGWATAVASTFQPRHYFCLWQILLQKYFAGSGAQH
jgi:hypothetical protein